MFASSDSKGQPKLRLLSSFAAGCAAILMLLLALGSGLREVHANETVRVQGATISFQPAPAIAQVLLEEPLGLEDGDYLFFLSVDLENGWKTYWRLPGRFGLAPAFDWSGSDNLAQVRPVFPQPSLFEESDGQSIGYSAPTLWPVIARAQSINRPLTLRLALEIGLCREICLPERIELFAQAPQLEASNSVSMAQMMALPQQLAAQNEPLEAVRLGWQGQQLRMELVPAIGPGAFAVAEDRTGRHVLLRPISAAEPSALLGEWRWSTEIDQITLVEPGWRMRIFSAN
jgi:DsbC/DsbD-like thiol-disulfide interchange protein